jgi:hypothetical protein
MAGGAAVITPNDGTDLPSRTFGIYVGGAGNVKVDMGDGTTVTFSGVVAGTVLPIQAKRVYATGTSASLMLALIQ